MDQLAVLMAEKNSFLNVNFLKFPVHKEVNYIEEGGVLGNR